MVDRQELHRAIIASEFYWFGGVLGPPKVYDSGARHSADPAVKRAVEHGKGAERDRGTSGPEYSVAVDPVAGTWVVGPVARG